MVTVSLAIFSSSLVGITTTLVVRGLFISPDLPSMVFLFFVGSRARPRWASCLQISRRRYQADSPMPAVKTSASNPPSGTVRLAIFLARR